MTDPSQWCFETTQIHAGQAPDSATGARALPIYQTTSYVFNDTEHAANLFALKEFGNIYTRIMNPTQDAVEQRIASARGGRRALLVASGQAAETSASSTSPRPETTSWPARSLYGGTYNLLKYTCRKLGVEVTFVEDPDDLEQWRAAVRPNTKAFFAETIANPKPGRARHRRAWPAVAHEAGVPLIVDNTVATPYLIRPLEWGADVVVHSATKYLGGHGTSIGGVIVDGGTFDFGKDPAKFPELQRARPELPRPVYARDLGVGSALGANLAYILKARVQLLRDLGPAISPFNAFLIAQGIETLSLRIERHVDERRQVAEWLEAHDAGASRWRYASLPTTPWHALAEQVRPKRRRRRRRLRDRGRARGGQEFVEALELHSHVANIGDVRSLVDPPGIHDPLASWRRGPASAGSRRAWCASRWASSTSTTSSPTSTRGSRRRGGLGADDGRRGVRARAGRRHHRPIALAPNLLPAPGTG